jgi:hypothetical protein
MDDQEPSGRGLFSDDLAGVAPSTRAKLIYSVYASHPHNFLFSNASALVMAGAIPIAESHSQVMSGCGNCLGQVPTRNVIENLNFEKLLDMLYTLPDEKVLKPPRCCFISKFPCRLFHVFSTSSLRSRIQ